MPKPYQWRIVASDAVLSRLVGIVEGCLVADPAARWTVPQVVDALTALRRDVGGGVATAGTGGSGHASGSVTPLGSIVAVPPTAPSTAVDGGAVTYDTLALLAALTSVGVDDAVVAAVADVIGHTAVSSVGVLRSCGVAATKVMAVRRLLTPRDDYALVCRMLDAGAAL